MEYPMAGFPRYLSVGLPSFPSLRQYCVGKITFSPLLDLDQRLPTASRLVFPPVSIEF